MTPETDLRVDDLADLSSIEATMHHLADQAGQLGGYVTTWVCQRAGVEASDACVFRPLGPVLGEVAAAVDDFVAGFDRLWRGLAGDVATTRVALAATEAEVVGALERMVV